MRTATCRTRRAMEIGMSLSVLDVPSWRNVLLPEQLEPGTRRFPKRKRGKPKLAPFLAPDRSDRRPAHAGRVAV